MLDFVIKEGPSPKCYFSQHRLPAYIDQQQPSTTKKPFSTALNQTSSRTVSLVSPQACHDA